MAQKDVLDRFYTQADVVDSCLVYLTGEMGIEYDQFSVIVEPSAGSGAFSSKLPNRRLAYDIRPAEDANGIEERDWFSVIRSDILPNGSPTDVPLTGSPDSSMTEILVVGNPPFGLRSSVAKRFITHAISIGATTIAFVLPDVFAKMSNQRCFPKEWRLVGVLKLRRDAFTIGGEPYHVPCSFFVWTRSDGIMPGIDLRERPVPQPREFSYLKRGDGAAHFSVNGNSGRVRDIADITNPKAEHYIQVSDGYDVGEIRERLASLDLSFKSSANGGVAWVNRDDINRAWLAQYDDGTDDGRNIE